MTLDEYKARVSALAHARDGEPVFNGSVDHAAVIVENMFKHANENVSILTGKLSARVYGQPEVVAACKNFLSDNRHTLSIIVEDKSILEGGDHPFISECEGKTNFSIRAMPEHLRSTYKFHFLVMDDDSFRFENDKGNCEAIAAFGDKKGAGNLRQIYSTLWTLALPAVG